MTRSRETGVGGAAVKEIIFLACQTGRLQSWPSLWQGKGGDDVALQDLVCVC